MSKTSKGKRSGKRVPGKGKVVEGFNIFFKDDFSIIDSEVSSRMTLPIPYLVDPDQLLIISDGKVFRLDYDGPSSAEEDYIKVYTELYRLVELGSVRELEQRYFENFDSQFHDLKKEFIDNCIDVPVDMRTYVPDLNKQIGKDLVKRVEEAHPKRPKKSKEAGKSLFSELGHEKLLILDKKMYELATIPQFLERFDRNAFDPQEPEFFEALIEMSRKTTPKLVSEYLEKNKPKIHKNAFYIIRDKIWCNEKSGELFLGGTYFIPEYVGHTDGMIDNYLRLIEREVKLDAAKRYEKNGMV